MTHPSNIRIDADTVELKFRLKARIMAKIDRDGEVHNNDFSRYIRNFTQASINDALESLEADCTLLRCVRKNPRGPDTVTWIRR